MCQEDADCIVLNARLLMLSIFTFCFFNDTATTEIYTLSLHDALPIWHGLGPDTAAAGVAHDPDYREPPRGVAVVEPRSEEHTSELQSQSNLVCRLLLEKKKRQTTQTVSGGVLITFRHL